MELKIRKLNNGYVIEHGYHNGEVYVDESLVVEEEDTMRGELEAFRTLCYHLQDILGVRNSKHLPDRLLIEFSSEINEKGD